MSFNIQFNCSYRNGTMVTFVLLFLLIGFVNVSGQSVIPHDFPIIKTCPPIVPKNCGFNPNAPPRRECSAYIPCRVGLKCCPTACGQECVIPEGPGPRLHPDCTLPKKTGPCRGAFRRWYFDSNLGKCNTFIYGGCQGNGNNFKKQKDCKRKCRKVPVFPVPSPIFPPARVCRQPKKVGPCKARVPRWYYNKFSRRCELFIFGGCRGNNNNFKSVGECKRRCTSPVIPIPPRNQVCKLPKKVGNCRAAFRRWYFDYKVGICKLFIYGGCRGNGNNFVTREQCSSKCENVCSLPKKVGPCDAAFKRYYFNNKTRKCMQFIYGGCQGNSNNFETRKQCKNNCRRRGKQDDD